jgi:hypothetical protein
MEERTCVHCGTSQSERRIEKCPMCHRYSCERCSYRRGGKIFCHVACADEFFFGGEESDT